MTNRLVIVSPRSTRSCGPRDRAALLTRGATPAPITYSLCLHGVNELIQPHGGQTLAATPRAPVDIIGSAQNDTVSRRKASYSLPGSVMPMTRTARPAR